MATCQIILDIVRHGYIKMSHINVIVFDEAHHAMKDSPMHQLMNQYAKASESERPRVIGLTGMLLSGAVKPATVTSQLEKLEATLHGTIATVHTIKDHQNVLIYSTNPDEKVVKYEINPPTEFEDEIKGIVRHIKGKVENWPENDSLKSKIKKMLDDFLFQQAELGEWVKSSQG